VTAITYPSFAGWINWGRHAWNCLKAKPVDQNQSRATAAARHAEQTSQTQRVIAKSERLMARSRELLKIEKEL
jgi:hypothetical protein